MGLDEREQLLLKESDELGGARIRRGVHETRRQHVSLAQLAKLAVGGYLVVGDAHHDDFGDFP